MRPFLPAFRGYRSLTLAPTNTPESISPHVGFHRSAGSVPVAEEDAA